MIAGITEGTTETKRLVPLNRAYQNDPCVYLVQNVQNILSTIWTPRFSSIRIYNAYRWNGLLEIVLLLESPMDFPLFEMLIVERESLDFNLTKSIPFPI